VPFFTDNFGVTNVSIVAQVVTVTTDADHGLQPNDFVTVDGLFVPAEIDSINATTEQATCTTATDHDLTLNPLENFKKFVRITGTGFDETYQLIATVNRRSFTISLEGKPTLPAGTLFLQQTISNSVNGLIQVLAVPANDQFTYSVNQDYQSPNEFTQAQVSLGHRISGAVNYDTILASYTAQLESELWCFVVLGDTIGNKDRRGTNDALTQQGQSMDFCQQTIQGVTIYFFLPNKGDILTQTNGRAARDFIEDIKPDVLRSVLGINYASGLSCQGQGVLSYLSDGYFDFRGSYYVHQFSFEQVLEITQGDTAIEPDDRAFRDIDIMLENQFSDITDYTACINLDEQPEN